MSCFKKPYSGPTSIKTKCEIVTLVSLLCLCSPYKENALPTPSSGVRELGKGYSSYKKDPKYQHMALHVSADGSWMPRGYEIGLCNCVCLRVELQ
jgi:hypothetical protein